MTQAADLYLITLARQMRSTDVLHVGASQMDVWQAAEVAKLLWAPRLRLVAACTYHLAPGSHIGTGLMQSRNYARDVIAARQATFTQSRVFDDLRRTRVVFAGGMQVDERGNANLIGFTNGDTFVRGPGSAGLPTLTSHSERFFIAVPRHNARTLVARVERISVLGDRRARREWGLPECSLQEVITPLASFRPDEQGLKVVGLSPGMTEAELQRSTGFALRMDPDCVVRPALTQDEKDALTQVRVQAGV
ncbi:MAG: hypothetical protein Q8N17_20095 [Burkholderiaceae bacterium]|nr:hypothetical protein [Burkholderiaceae bacterium]